MTPITTTTAMIQNACAPQPKFIAASEPQRCLQRDVKNEGDDRPGDDVADDEAKARQRIARVWIERFFAQRHVRLLMPNSREQHRYTESKATYRCQWDHIP